MDVEPMDMEGQQYLLLSGKVSNTFSLPYHGVISPLQSYVIIYFEWICITFSLLQHITLIHYIDWN